jgi:uncharacterized OB-fold protein
MTDKPVPMPTTDTEEFWRACNHDQLMYQRCTACGHVQFYPRPFCTECQSDGVTSHVSSGRGTIHSFTVVHRAANRSFDGDVPFVLALVDLDEGFRIMTNIVGEGRLSATIDQRVRIVFEPRTADQKIPQAVLEASP